MDTSTPRVEPRPDDDLRSELVRSLGMPVGSLGALSLGIALVPVRGLLSTPVVIVVFTAVVATTALVGGRGAGMTCAVVAGLSIDSFLRRPYGVLDLDQPAFWWSTALLVVVAILAGRVGKRPS